MCWLYNMLHSRHSLIENQISWRWVYTHTMLLWCGPSSQVLQELCPHFWCDSEEWVLLLFNDAQEFNLSVKQISSVMVLGVSHILNKIKQFRALEQRKCSRETQLERVAVEVQWHIKDFWLHHFIPSLYKAVQCTIFEIGWKKGKKGERRLLVGRRIPEPRSGWSASQTKAERPRVAPGTGGKRARTRILCCHGNILHWGLLQGKRFPFINSLIFKGIYKSCSHKPKKIYFKCTHSKAFYCLPVWQYYIILFFMAVRTSF